MLLILLFIELTKIKLNSFSSIFLPTAKTNSELLSSINNVRGSFCILF